MVGRDSARRGWNVVVTTTMLIICNDQQGLIPRRTAAQRVVNVVYQLLAKRHVIVGMLTISTGLPTRLEKCVSRQGAGRGGRRGMGKYAEVAVVGVGRVCEIQTG